MDVIARVQAKLANYPELRYTATADSIRAEPVDDSGFAVSLHVVAGKFVVHFDGWHEEFTSEDEAVNCFALGISGACRLAVTYRGSTPTKWVLETQQNDSWLPDSETALFLFPFWRRPRVVFKRNHVRRAT